MPDYKIILTCSHCRNSYPQGEELHPGSDCPTCLSRNEMLPWELKRDEEMSIVGKLIIGVPMFENSDWADNTLCSVLDPHTAHTWFDEPGDDDLTGRRYVCPGVQADHASGRSFSVLLTRRPENEALKVAGISRLAEPLLDTVETWHVLGRECWMLTLTDDENGLPGVKLEALVPSHKFTAVFLSSDSVPPPSPITLDSGLKVEED